MKLTTCLLSVLMIMTVEHQGQGITKIHAAEKSNNRMHYVLIIDTNAANIGSTTRVDLSTVREHILDPLKSVGRLGKGILLQGKSVNPRAILKAVRSLPVRKGDTVFVYYTGHGCEDSRYGHILSTSGGKLSRAKLRNTMYSLKPGLVVLLTDCCANRPIQSNFRLPYKSGGIEVSMQVDVVQRLFLGARGVVDVNACRPGDYAACNQRLGGVFTAIFGYTLSSELKTMTWRSALDRTAEVFRKAGRTQRPYAYSLPG